MPFSSSRVPGRSRSASQAWLNQTAFIGPLVSATAASTMRRLRRRVGRTRAERTSTITVASSPIRRSADLADLGAVAVAVREVPEQVAERLDPDLGGGRGELRARPPSAIVIGASSRLGRGGGAQLDRAQRLAVLFVAGADRARECSPSPTG